MLSFLNKKAIVFDLDGTIVNLDVNWPYLSNLLSNRYTKIYGEHCDFNHVTACLDGVVKKNDENELQKFFKLIQECELKNINNAKPIKATIFFLNNLELFGIDKSVKLAILSLNTRKAIIESLKLVDVDNKFDFIIGREDVRKWKPDPVGLLKIKEYYALKKEEIIYIGDLEKDLQTGKNAEIESFLIDEIKTLVNKKG